MDIAKFQSVLSHSLKDIFVIHCKLSCEEYGFIPPMFNDSKFIQYDLLIIEQIVGDETLEIKVSFRDENNPWATIDIKGKNIGVGFYASEDPVAIVWEQRVFKALKDEFAKYKVDGLVYNAIQAINAAFLASK